MGNIDTEGIIVANMAYEYLQQLPNLAKERYLRKLKLIGLDQASCPYKLAASVWEQDPTKWPEMTYGDMYHYLIESPGVYTRESMKNFRALEAHNYFTSGLSEACSHVGAMLFKIEAAIRLGYTKLSCTSQPCSWNACFSKGVQPAPISQIKFYKESTKAKVKKRLQKANRNTQLSDQEQRSLLKALSESRRKPVCLSSFSDFCSPFKPKKPVCNDYQ